MNILYICPKDPRLTNGGSEQRTNLLWESLKRYGKVYTFLLSYKQNVESTMVDGEHPIYIQCPRAKYQLFWRLVNAILSQLSVLSIYRRNVISIQKPKEVFSGVHFDIVVTRYINPLCLYKYWEIAPLYIDIDDHPYQVFQTTYKKRLPFGLKTIGKYLTKYQTDCLLSKSTGGWIANEEQLTLCRMNYEFLPNIPQMPSSEYNAGASERKNFFTVGAMGYEPNKEGITRFLKQIWPVFHQKFPDVEYYIVGKGATAAEAALWNSYECVKYLGYVENLEAMYEKTFATVVPVYSGGGTCIKTLEAMAYSRPCLSTEFGARGLSDDVIEQERGVMLFTNANSFIKAYEKLQVNSCRQKIELQGRDVILQHYSKENFDNAVDKILSKVKK